MINSCMFTVVMFGLQCFELQKISKVTIRKIVVFEMVTHCFFLKLRFSKLNVTCEKKHLKCLGLDVIQNSSSPFYRLGVQTTI